MNILMTNRVARAALITTMLATSGLVAGSGAAMARGNGGGSDGGGGDGGHAGIYAVFRQDYNGKQDRFYTGSLPDSCGSYHPGRTNRCNMMRR